MEIVGLDIGGANVKAAHSSGDACSRPFALWKTPTGLPGALSAILAKLPAADLLAITMTGELCDCFETKRQGVHAILDAAAEAAGVIPVRVWSTDGRLVDIEAAREDPLRVAAANWHALATYVGRFVPSGAGILIDVGSTTTDIIPLQGGKPSAFGLTDPDLLQHRELLYTGIRRTPVCALLGNTVAAEVFATALDAYLTLGLVPEEADHQDTADGRPATRMAAHARLARMICADTESCSLAATRELAQRVFEVQRHWLRQALNYVIEAHQLVRPAAIVVAGSGEFLARSALAMPPPLRIRQTISLADMLGAEISAAACAHAVAMLAAEEQGA